MRHIGSISIETAKIRVSDMALSLTFTSRGPHRVMTLLFDTLVLKTSPVHKASLRHHLVHGLKCVGEEQCTGMESIHVLREEGRILLVRSSHSIVK